MAGLVAFLRALLMPVLLAAAGAMALAPVLFFGATDIQSAPRYRPDGSEDAPTSPLTNLAATALFRAGFIQIAPNYDGEDAGTPPGDVQWRVAYLPHVCTGDPLVKALVAAEAFARPAWRRQLESALGEAWFAVTGAPPDLSYGMAQIRLGTARKAIAAAQARLGPYLGAGAGPDVSDRGLLDALADACASMRIATLVIDAGRAPGSDAADAAIRYRGGTEAASVRGAVTYERLAAEMAERVLPALVNDSALDMLAVAETAGTGIYVQQEAPIEPTTEGAAPLPRPFACVDRDGPDLSATIIHPGRGETPISGRIPLADFRMALASFDAPATDLVVLAPGPPDASLAALADVAEIDAIHLPGLLDLPWRSVERRAAPIGTLPCNAYAFAAEPHPGAFFAAVADRAELDEG